MLLLAYLEGESKSLPAVLQPDLKFVLQKTPVLLEEMLKIAVMPRPPNNHGWLVRGLSGFLDCWVFCDSEVVTEHLSMITASGFSESLLSVTAQHVYQCVVMF